MNAPEREALALTDRQLFDIAHPMMNGGSFNNSAAAVEYGRRVLRAAGLSSPAVTVTEGWAFEPFIKAAAIIRSRPQDYPERMRIAMLGGLADAMDLYAVDFLKLADALKSTTPQTGSQE